MIAICYSLVYSFYSDLNLFCTWSQVLRTIQAKGIKGLREEERKNYVPPVGGGFGAVSIPLVDQLALAESTSSATIPYGPGPFKYSQARIVADHVMAQVHMQSCICKIFNF